MLYFFVFSLVFVFLWLYFFDLIVIVIFMLLILLLLHSASERATQFSLYLSRLSDVLELFPPSAAQTDPSVFLPCATLLQFILSVTGFYLSSPNSSASSANCPPALRGLLLEAACAEWLELFSPALRRAVVACADTWHPGLLQTYLASRSHLQLALVSESASLSCPSGSGAWVAALHALVAEQQALALAEVPADCPRPSRLADTCLSTLCSLRDSDEGKPAFVALFLVLCTHALAALRGAVWHSLNALLARETLARSLPGERERDWLLHTDTLRPLLG
jgi:hypothetical protein